MNKIFCVGLNKTGTTSLHHAFQILGFKSVHHKCEIHGNIKKVIFSNVKNGLNPLSGIDFYDAYSDWNYDKSTLYLYKEFDKLYPNSKFILNTREIDEWLLSRERHVKKISNLKALQSEFPKSDWLNINKTAWKNQFSMLHADVKNYFKDRPNDLLIMNVSAGDGWDKLCPFLNMQIPDQPFPYMNKFASLNYK